jgi:hypothetical protein
MLMAQVPPGQWRAYPGARKLVDNDVIQLTGVVRVLQG